MTHYFLSVEVKGVLKVGACSKCGLFRYELLDDQGDLKSCDTSGTDIPYSKKVKIEGIDISPLRNDESLINFTPGEAIDLSKVATVLSPLYHIILGITYFREEYRIAFDKWDDETSAGMILTGSPGIGKSTFGWFLLCYLLNRGEKIIFWKYNYVILFDGTTARLISKSEIRTSSDAVIIYDDPKGFHKSFNDCEFKKVLIIHSPSGELSNSIKTLQIRGKVWIMNPASFEECQQIRAKCRWSISEEDMTENFHIGGGIIRGLDYDIVNLIYDVDRGCSKVAMLNFVDLVNCNQLPDNSGKISHRVIHLRRIDDINRSILEFGSKYIKDKILSLRSDKDSFQLLMIANKVDINGSLRGEIFENIIHYNLSEKFHLEFTRRPLLLKENEPFISDGIISISLLNKLEFSKLSDIKKVDMDTYYYPRDKRICLKSILDSFFVSLIDKKVTIVLLQINLAESHPVKRQGLKDIIDIVKNSQLDFKNILLVFLTPPVVFEKWKIEQQGPDDVINTNGSIANNKICNQEVWCLRKRNGVDIWMNL